MRCIAVRRPAAGAAAGTSSERIKIYYSRAQPTSRDHTEEAQQAHEKQSHTPLRTSRPLSLVGNTQEALFYTLVGVVVQLRASDKRYRMCTSVRVLLSFTRVLPPFWLVNTKHGISSEHTGISDPGYSLRSRSPP